MSASERLPEGSPKGGRSPILKFKEVLKDTLRSMLLDCFQQLLKIKQRFLYTIFCDFVEILLCFSRDYRVGRRGQNRKKSRLDFFPGVASSTPSTYPHYGAERRCRNASRKNIHRVVHLSTIPSTRTEGSSFAPGLKERPCGSSAAGQRAQASCPFF